MLEIETVEVLKKPKLDNNHLYHLKLGLAFVPFEQSFVKNFQSIADQFRAFKPLH
jgi:hypothetical protein